MQKLSGIMDFSNYDSKHELFNADNRNKIKFWKDENKGNVVVSSINLRASRGRLFASRKASPGSA